MNSDYLYKVIKHALLKLQAKANQNEAEREKLIPYIKNYQKDLTTLKRKQRAVHPNDLNIGDLAVRYETQVAVADHEVILIMRKTERIIQDLAKCPRRGIAVNY